MRFKFLIILILMLSISLAFADVSIKVSGDTKIKMEGTNLYLSGDWHNVSEADSALKMESAKVIFFGNNDSKINNKSGEFSTIQIAKSDSTKKVILDTTVVVTDSLQLARGVLDNSEHNITIADSAVIEIEQGDLEEEPEYQGFIDVAYTGSTPALTGLELPPTVNVLTINNSGGVILDKAVTVKNALNLFKGNLNDSTFSVALHDTAKVYKKIGTLTDTLHYEGRKNITYTGEIAATTGKELRPHVDHLTIDNPGNVTLTQDITVDSTLRLLRGHVITGDYTLTLGPYAIITEGGPSDVWGALEYPPFWVGTDSLNTMGVFIGTGVDTLGFVQIIIISGPGTAVNIETREGINRKWIINSQFPPVHGRQLILSWKAEEDNENFLPRMLAWKSTNEGETWQSIGQIQDASESRSLDLNVFSLTGLWTVVSEGEINFNKVDINLIQRLIAKLGSSLGDDKYDENYDSDDDGDIDMRDLNYFMRSWGTHQD